MYTIFNRLNAIAGATPPAAGWSLIKEGLTREYDQAQTYYRRLPVVSDASHLLIKVLYSLAAPLNYSEQDLYRITLSQSDALASIVGMVSPVSFGTVMRGVFFPKSCREIVISTSEEFDPYEAARNWKQLQPVRILSHPRSDVGLHLPNGRGESFETGLCITAVNIAMLAIQYRGFRIEQKKWSEQTGMPQRNIGQFLGSYPLVNAMPSFCDVALTNRITNKVVGKPLGRFIRSHPYNTIDYTAKVDEVQNTLLGFMDGRKMAFTDIMRSTPLVFSPNLLVLSKLPEVALTRQMLSALFTSRLTTLDYLFNVTKINPAITNPAQVYEVLREFQQLKIDQNLRKSLPRELYFDVLAQVDNLRAAVELPLQAASA